ncbi:hypothetical protein PR202_ga29061 [Eleusine coracana subsp. coracana]|uniref:Calmodulin-binding family protein n=1 Tax=Eleusine coracana subsp. coracana TaxID=191504 RepID=A0AAV5DL16_ELECO|nr:hypothetical protein QOZ80_7AG0578600 [Eleusine coracana subsp. coracana]GJN10916.1 hypothetical protein PR202_ga29061 [Eleusine coracana subsp. coracana]
MGVLFSCPVDEDIAVEAGLPSAAPAPSADEEPTTVLKASLGSGKLRIEGSLSFKRGEQQSPSAALLQVETKISITSSSSSSPCSSPRAAAAAAPRELLRTRFADAAAPESPKQESAAVTLQKVYKSFRTRRRLADCAVLVEQSWWKLLDFALLKRSSVSFFDIEKQESAVSKWYRARTRAAKVGKGLSKDDKAQKLALQHWLEAIDPRHRYGHNLHYYYDCWLQCESKEPFFYWLDVGEGKEINLERCSRSTLLSQCIKYLGPKEREDYEVVIEDGKFMYKNSRQVLDTSGGPRDAKWIFVLSTSKNLYVGQKKKGTFQHSSFLAGGATSAAGRLVVEDGVLKAIWPHSGHYRPTEENFQEFQSFLRDNDVDLTDVKMSPDEEDEEFWSRLKSIPSDLHAAADEPEGHDTVATAEETDLCQPPQPTAAASLEEASQHEQTICNNLKPIATIRTQQCSSEKSEASTICEDGAVSLPEEDRQEKEEDSSDDDPSAVPREKILERISSKKEAKSYQLGKQVSFKWTTGAGPRIVCVRDYPPELQLRALERVHLSPRSGRAASSRFASPQRSGSPMARGCCEPFTPPREAFRTHLQQGLMIR